MKALKIIRSIFVWLMVALAVFMMIFTIVSVSTFDRADRNLFGYKAFIVLSDSMSKTDFDAGDLVLVKEVDPSTLKEGDIISYTSTNTENVGKLVTHKIRKLTTTASGDPGFITYGTTTGEDDKTVVTYPYIVGKYTGKIPKMGHFFQFLKTTPGYIVCILVPFMLLILSQAYESVKLFKQYKAEQNAALEEEKSKIAAEKEETQKMMAELLAMKAQMEANGKAPAQTAEPAPETVEEPKENPNAERIATMKKDLEEVEKNLTELTGAKNALGAIGESTPEIEAKIAQISLTIEKLATVKEQISGEISRLEG